jgi:UDP-N-acetylglucosamine diphosphorylase/glucosamine-1-phosphate N-acetyltransferase
MKALILAAGRGERLRPITDNCPKVMVPLVGKPVMQYILENLVKLGIRHFVIVVGFMSDAVKRHFGDGSNLGASISYVQQDRLTGEAEAILCAEKALSSEESFLVALGDFIADPGMVRETLRIGLQENADVTLALARVLDPTQYGVVALDDRNRITRIMEKPPKNLAPSNIAAAGAYVFKPTVFDVLRKTGHLERSIAKMIRTGARVYGSLWSGEWIDVGRPWDLLRANKFLLERIFESQGREIVCKSRIPSTAKIVAPAYIGPNVEIMENAFIKEAYVDSNSRIGNNALIRNYSYLGKGATAGYTSEIRNSIVMDETQIGHLAFIGDTILGQRCEVGAGTVTANLRFDRRSINVSIAGRKVDTALEKFGAVIGDEAQIGINVSMYPGRKIGSRAWVGPGVVVSKDIPRDAKVSLVQELRSTK